MAILFILKGDPGTGIAACISSVFVKFTLLTDSTAFILSMSAGEVLTFPLDYGQCAEIWLTAAVASFGLVLVAKRTPGWRAALLLLGLFTPRWLHPDAEDRLWLSCIYPGLAGELVIRNGREVIGTFRKAN